MNLKQGFFRLSFFLSAVWVIIALAIISEERRDVFLLNALFVVSPPAVIMAFAVGAAWFVRNTNAGNIDWIRQRTFFLVCGAIAVMWVMFITNEPKFSRSDFIEAVVVIFTPLLAIEILVAAIAWIAIGFRSGEKKD
jgi:hypothetical protein